MTTWSRLTASALVLGVSVLGFGVAQAQTVEEFYKGKTITMENSAAVGGSSDFFGRQLIQFMGKHIPGNPTIVMTNKPGAGGMVEAAYIQRNAPADGTVIGFLQRNNLYQSLVGKDDKFDPREVHWIGSMNNERYLIAAWTPTSPVKTSEEMFTTKMILGATGFANENRLLPAIMNEYLGTKFEIVHGYTGSEEVGIAMERGEVDGKAGTVNNLLSNNEAAWVADGRLKVLFQMDWTNHPAWPDTMNFSNIVKDESVKSLINFIILPFEAGRPLAVPKGVPEDRVAALRKAFDDTMNDPEFIAHMKNLKTELALTAGPRIEEIVGVLYGTPEPVLDNVRKALAPQ